MNVLPCVLRQPGAKTQRKYPSGIKGFWLNQLIWDHDFPLCSSSIMNHQQGANLL